jgi:hypothetical protein
MSDAIIRCGLVSWAIAKDTSLLSSAWPAGSKAGRVTGWDQVQEKAASPGCG